MTTITMEKHILKRLDELEDFAKEVRAALSAPATAPETPHYTHADVAQAHAEGYKLGLAQVDRPAAPEATCSRDGGCDCGTPNGLCGFYVEPATAPAHTEDEVQELLRVGASIWNQEHFQTTVRRILGGASTMTTREAFEAWAKGLGQNLERLPESSPFAGNYKSILMQSRFDAWQAATNAALERAGKACKKVADKQSTLGRQFAAIECGEAIRALKDET